MSQLLQGRLSLLYDKVRNVSFKARPCFRAAYHNGVIALSSHGTVCHFNKSEEVLLPLTKRSI